MTEMSEGQRHRGVGCVCQWNNNRKQASSMDAWCNATVPKSHIAGVPDFGWRVGFNYKCPEKCSPFTKPRLKQMKGIPGATFRYTKLWIQKKQEGKRPFIDHTQLVPHKPIYGAPIGGIGCGTIGRGYRGEFCRFQMVPGMYHHKVIKANQFIACIRKNGQTVYQQVLCPYKNSEQSLKAWVWQFNTNNATYHALYPRSWTVYDIPQYDVRLICRQISPIIPHDYKDTSLPVAVFDWTVENNSSDNLEISITLAFKNGVGSKSSDAAGGVWNEPFCCKESEGEVSGVMIHQELNGMLCTYGVAAAHKDDISVTRLVDFDPHGTGHELWGELQNNGHLLLDEESSAKTQKGKESATAVCALRAVDAKSSGKLYFSLAWDMPVIHFSNKEKKYHRRYCRWFGSQGTACPSLVSYALSNYKDWEQKIDEWQRPILENKNLPAWYKSALFNELYYLSDGGTLWVDPVNDPSVEDSKTSTIVQEYSKFAYLEGHEYRMYNTFDVHHYASFALIMLWPKIQLSIQYDIADAIEREDPEEVVFHMRGIKGIVKVRNRVPHDIGDPEGDPWTKLNAYMSHPTDDWKDLNTKFVLQVYRDYVATGDEEYLYNMYPKTKLIMDAAMHWDIDNDGIIDNGGYADQTYDAWVVTGASAYTGGMWLAALRMMVEMAGKLGKTEDKEKYSEVLDRGKASFDHKLWNGRYYNYDSSASSYHNSIMADMLAGHWFLKATGLHDNTIFPTDHVQSSLKCIYENNVLPFYEGNMGAINGMRPNGKKDTSSMQAEEFWVGVTYGLGATMIQEGLLDEGFRTAGGAYHACWEKMGLHFQTPEAYMEEKHYRSLGYMRPLCVWSIQWALEKFHPNLLAS